MRSSKNLIYGRNPVWEALHAEQVPDRILMQHQISGERIGDIIRLAKEKHVPLIRVPAEKLNTLVRGAHQGIVAFGAFVQYIPLQDIISSCYDQGRPPFLLLLDGITDVRNTGAIIRTALCCGVDAVVFSEKNSAPLHEDMVKTSAGAMMKMAFCREKNLETILNTLKMNGIRIYSSDLKANQTLMSLDFSEPSCLILGSEDTGISSTSRKYCDQTFRIPMKEGFDSLNVSVACGIICFEVLKQRMSNV
ncbi:MAG TPA: 23S rRNA (guanosine(2251)-2'-O)-methyltransferase RlmB [Chitinophagaceae bacterium]|nr:23S rRNA (guanosine(2251)-2'-O)-methyltransferase RlmB [Chitinophagaceae bacterium]